MANFNEAAEQYQDRINEHECSGDDDCPVPSAFYLIAIRNEDGLLEIWTGGHRSEPASMAEATVTAIDAIVANRELSPLEAFMTSRDIVHTAADSVDPSPEASQALNEFAMRGDDE